ncbi:hypothetical protein B0H13DRAFT_2286261 [Mycena leptocephala]|nr:hypothetical protein B0H13DRAFT_2286261 [Mycena leptocephala]
MVGPALPQALRAVRYPLYDPDGNFRETDKDDPDTMATTCQEEHGPSRQRTAILNEYPTDDLVQLYAVVRFFHRILEGVLRRLLTSSCFWGRAVLQARGEIVHTNSSKRTHCTTVTSPPAGEHLDSRDVEPPEDEPAMQWILDTINGANDAYWHRLFIWPGKPLKGWLKHSSGFSGSLTASIVRHGGNLRRINYNTTTIESFILNLLSQSRLESLRHVAVENSEEINFVETRDMSFCIPARIY